MPISLLLLVFVLGCLVGVICVEIRRKIKFESQRAIERRYEAVLWKQLSQCQELLQSNNDLLTDNIELRQKYFSLQEKYEKTLAALN